MVRTLNTRKQPLHERTRRRETHGAVVAQPEPVNGTPFIEALFTLSPDW